MIFAAIATATLALFLIGGLGFLYLQAKTAAGRLTGLFEMRVFMKEGTTYKQITETAGQIREIPGVGTVSWIPRDKAWELEKKKNPDLTAGIDNPLPDAFKVTVKELARGDAIVAAIRKLPTVEPEGGVQYLSKEARFVDTWAQRLQAVGGPLAGILLLIAAILIYNTIRLTVISRRLEVRVMSLVGASRFVIQAPYMIEGVVYGTIGGLLAALLLYVSQIGVGLWLRSSTSPFPFTQSVEILCLAGGIFGLLCSVVAVKVPLRYR